MKHKTGSKKVAAVLLSVALLLSCIPATALAAEAEQDMEQPAAETLLSAGEEDAEMQDSGAGDISEDMNPVMDGYADETTDEKAAADISAAEDTGTNQTSSESVEKEKEEKSADAAADNQDAEDIVIAEETVPLTVSDAPGSSSDNPIEMTVGTEYEVTVTDEAGVWYSFTPKEDGTYIFSSYDYYDDPLAYFYESEPSGDGDKYDDSDSAAFVFEKTLTAGKTYYLLADSYDGTDHYTLKVERRLLDVEEYEQSIPVALNGAVTLVPKVSSDVTLSYKWYAQDDADHELGTEATYQLTSVSRRQVIYCDITATSGSDSQTETVSFDVTVDTGFTAEADGATYYDVAPGASATLRVKASVSESMGGVHYKWSRFAGYNEYDGEQYDTLENQTASLTVTPAKGNSEEHYYCEVTDDYGNTETIGFCVHVVTDLSTTDGKDSYNISAAPGVAVTLTANVTSKVSPITYTWYYNSVDDKFKQTATGNSLTVYGGLTSDVWYCEAYDGYNWLMIEYHVYNSTSLVQASAIATKETAKTVENGSTTGINIGKNGEAWLKFTPTASKTYTIYSEGIYDTYGMIYNAAGEDLDYNDDGGNGYNFSISYAMQAGQTYYIKSQMFSSESEGVFYVSITDAVQEACDEGYVHDWQLTSYQDATTTAEGYKLYTCRGCGKTRKETIPKRILQETKKTETKTGLALNGTAAYTRTASAGAFKLDTSANPTGTNLTYKSSNTAVATVSNGTVIPVAAGTAVITVTAAKDGYAAVTKNITVTVTGLKVGGSITAGTKAAKASYKVTGADTVTFVKSKQSAKKAKAITVPNTVTINGATYKVTAVGKNAAKGFKKVTKVTIGKNVVSIGATAFANEPALKSMTINSSVLTSIGKNFVKGDKKLKKITIKSKKLVAKKCKKCLSGSKVKTVAVPKAAKKNYAKKIFIKKVCGLKITVK